MQTSFATRFVGSVALHLGYQNSGTNKSVKEASTPLTVIFSSMFFFGNCTKVYLKTNTKGTNRLSKEEKLNKKVQGALAFLRE